jgi:Ser/Thr protein kinase RdoA (MazF antagonist)
MDAAELARRFGLGRAVKLSAGPVARGKQGLIWRLDTTDGSWAVKVPFDLPDEDEVAASTRFQEAAHAGGVPTPQVRRALDGDVFATIAGQQVRVYEWVDLKAPDPTLDPGQVGAVVAAIHRVQAPDPSPLDPWYHEPVGARRWDQLIALLSEAGAPFAGRLADLRDELVALESWIEPVQTIQTCHRDLWADNVLPTADGGICVIDWENSGPADPNQELACVLFGFGRSDKGRIRALADAYRQARGPAVVNRRGHFSMLIAQLGHINEIAATDWLTPNPRSPQRSDSEAWISETLDEPHTREVLETILSAASGLSESLGSPWPAQAPEVAGVVSLSMSSGEPRSGASAWLDGWLAASLVWAPWSSDSDADKVVSASRKSSPAIRSRVHGTRARTVAVRGMPASSPISPA